MIGTTTNFFIKARNAFRGSPRAVPVAMPANVQTSSAQGLAPTQMGAPFVPTVAPSVFLGEKKSPDVESLGSVMVQNTMAPVKVALHAIAEVPPRFVASLVGGK